MHIVSHRESHLLQAAEQINSKLAPVNSRSPRFLRRIQIFSLLLAQRDQPGSAGTTPGATPAQAAEQTDCGNSDSAQELGIIGAPRFLRRIQISSLLFGSAGSARISPARLPVRHLPRRPSKTTVNFPNPRRNWSSSELSEPAISA